MILKNIPLGSPEEFNVVIEIPKGSPNKYEYDEELDVMKLDFVFSNGFSLIHNYGFIPQTKGGDGDHLDVFVLSSYPLSTGSVVPCRAIGMIELLDRGLEDNKIIAVPAIQNPNSHYTSLKDLSSEQIEEFKIFFKELARQKDKKTEIIAFHDKGRAIEEIKKASIL